MHTRFLLVLSVAALTACATPETSTDMTYLSANQDVAKPSTARATPPPMATNRKVNEQDCSKPVVLDQGNLRCR